MFRSEYWLVFVIVSLMIVIMPTNTHAENTSDVVLAANDISLTVDFGNGTILQFSELNGSTVLDVTESVLDIEVEWFGSFAYVRGIEGVVGAGEYGWQYWVNNVFASGAANLHSLENGDTVRWEYSSPEPQSQSDPTFIPGVTIVSLASIGFLAIVYVQTSRRIQ